MPQATSQLFAQETGKFVALSHERVLRHTGSPVLVVVSHESSALKRIEYYNSVKLDINLEPPCPA